MSYIGLDPNTPLLNTSTQFFSGNGAVTQYTLSRAVASSSDLDVIVGNVPQVPGVDYVAGNTTIIFTVAPGSGTDNVAVTYRGGALNSLDLSASVFQSGAVGAPSVYSLASNNAGIYWASANTMGIVVTGANRALFNANATSVNSVTGAIVTPGGIGVGGNIHIGNQATVNGGVESTSVSTGTLRVIGGAGITGNLNIGGDITCVGDFTVNGTFTTTGTDSLEVNDPFIFLANANPGDTYDSGVISEYFDGTNTRYTGYFRDITDNTFKFFGNLLPKPGTTVDTANTSYVAANVTVGNLSATGNITASYFVGNGAALTGISSDTTQIQNGNTKVLIPSINGNIVNNVNGVTIANVWSGGISVVGAVAASTTMTATGNITAGNIDTAGQISATGNIAATANVSGGNILTGGLISATGNIRGGNISAPVGLIDASAYGTIISTGNVSGTNLNTSGLISAGGNITGGNIFTVGNVSATGNVLGNFILGNVAFATGANQSHNHPGVINGTSNIRIGVSNGNANVSIGGISNVAVFADTGLFVTGLTSVTGNITGGNLITGALAQAVTLSVTGGATFSTATEEIGIGNSMTSGVIYIGGPSQTGLLQLGQSTASQTANLATGATGSGNTKTLNLGTNGAANSQTSINIGTNLGNATVQYTANTIVAMANTGGSALSVAGNVTGGNLRTAGEMSATGNVTGGNIVTAGAVSASGVVSAAGNVTGGNIITGGAVSAVGAISATANVTGGNIITGGAVSATGNVSATANVLGGNVVSAGLVSATGNITGGNIVTGGLVTATGNVNTAAGVLATGNIRGGNILAPVGLIDASAYGTIISTGNVSGTNLNTSGLMSATGNVTGGNISTGGLVTATGNVNTAAGVLATGNIRGGNILAPVGLIDASAYGTIISTGNVSGTNLNTSGLMSATGNVTGGNLLTAGLISATGNINAGNFVGTLNGSGANVTSISATNISTGTLAQARLANTQITVNGTAISLGSSGTITATATNALTIGTGLGGTSYNGSTAVTITNTGVTSIVAGTNIAVSGATGAVTVSVSGTVAQATNAGTVGGFTPSQTAGTASRVVVADSNGYILNNYFNSTDNSQSSGVTGVMVKAGDNYFRTGTAAAIATFISGQTMNINGSATTATNINTTSGNIGFSSPGVGVGSLTQAGPKIQSQSSGAAVMSFDRVGAYLVNMGLDTDNVFKIGGGGDGNNVYRIQITAAGVITGTATSARYADLAENYTADSAYEPGTVLEFGGDQEVTLSTAADSNRVAGVVSTNPAYLMNSMLEGNHVVALALTGRTPTKVFGPVRKGDMMVSAGNGHARACATPAMGSVIGKALQNFDGHSGVIEIVVGRM